jgi:hypothetical protein
VYKEERFIADQLTAKVSVPGMPLGWYSTTRNSYRNRYEIIRHSSEII